MPSYTTGHVPPQSRDTCTTAGINAYVTFNSHWINYCRPRVPDVITDKAGNWKTSAIPHGSGKSFEKPPTGLYARTLQYGLRNYTLCELMMLSMQTTVQHLPPASQSTVKTTMPENSRWLSTPSFTTNARLIRSKRKLVVNFRWLNPRQSRDVRRKNIDWMVSGCRASHRWECWAAGGGEGRVKISSDRSTSSPSPRLSSSSDNTSVRFFTQHSGTTLDPSIYTSVH